MQQHLQRVEAAASRQHYALLLVLHMRAIALQADRSRLNACPAVQHRPDMSTRPDSNRWRWQHMTRLQAPRHRCSSPKLLLRVHGARDISPLLSLKRHCSGAAAARCEPGYTRPYLWPEALMDTTFLRRKSHFRSGCTNGATKPPLAPSTWMPTLKPCRKAVNSVRP